MCVLQSRATAIGGRQFPGRSLLHLPIETHQANGLDHVEHRAAHGPGVHPQSAADAAGNAFQKFQPGQIRCAWLRPRPPLSFAPAPQLRRSPATSMRLKCGVRQTDDDAAKTAVLHQQIRAAPENEKRPAVLMAIRQDGRQILLRGRLNINVRRPANPQASCVWPAVRRGESPLPARRVARAHPAPALRSAQTSPEWHRGEFKQPLPLPTRRLERPAPASAIGRPARGSRRLRLVPCCPQSGNLAMQPGRESVATPSPAPAPAAASMASAICSAACGACHCASALCIFSCTAGFSITSNSNWTNVSGVAVFCSSKRAAPVASKARAL